MYACVELDIYQINNYSVKEPNFKTMLTVQVSSIFENVQKVPIRSVQAED